MAIERYNSKTDVGVKLVLVFFVCVLSFAIGTFVGKKFSDNRHRMAQFEPQSAEAGGHDVASQEEKSKSGNLSDDEIAKLAEEFVNEDETSEKSGPAVAKAEAPKKANAEHAEHAEASPAKHLPAKVAVAVKDTLPRIQLRKKHHLRIMNL